MKRKSAVEPSPVVASANASRGEHELTLAGVAYRLRPSHTAIDAIETKTDRQLLPLIRAGNAGEISLKHLGMIAAELIRAGAAPNDAATAHVGADKIAQLIFEEGVPAVTARLTLCLLDAATGGRTASGEAKAATA